MRRCYKKALTCTLLVHFALYAILTWINVTVFFFSTGLDKYTQYRVRVAASTAAGESPLSDEDNIFVLTTEDGMEINLTRFHLATYTI